MKKIKDKIIDERKYRVGSLRGKADQLKKICEGLIDKIDRDGISASYSINIGVDKLATSINDTCRCLYFLKTWEDALDKQEREEDQNRQDLRGQDSSGPEDSCQGDQS
jgi:DNA gyrase inhibitor GyrI